MTQENTQWALGPHWRLLKDEPHIAVNTTLVEGCGIIAIVFAHYSITAISQKRDYLRWQLMLFGVNTSASAKGSLVYVPSGEPPRHLAEVEEHANSQVTEMVRRLRLIADADDNTLAEFTGDTSDGSWSFVQGAMDFGANLVGTIIGSTINTVARGA